MKRRLLRTLGFVIVAGVTVGGATVGYLYVRKPATAPPPGITVPMTEARIARGRYIYKLADCDGCHSERDYSRFGGPVVESGRGRGVVFPPELGLPGTITAPNITPDPETGLGAWTDGEKIRAIREGVGRDGAALFPMMPYEAYRSMSDEDVESLVAYLNTLPPIRNQVPRSQVRFPVSLLMKSAPQPAGPVPPPDRSDRLRYGEYLVKIGDCGGCHTPAENGKPLAGMAYAGGKLFRIGPFQVVSSNITPDPKSGLGTWSEDYFLRRFYLYRDYVNQGSPHVGKESFTLMPWLNLATLPPDDLKAMYAYLRTVPPVHHYVNPHPAAGGGERAAR
jgi:hypothetical protein